MKTNAKPTQVPLINFSKTNLHKMYFCSHLHR